MLNKLRFLLKYRLWVHTPANDNWPVADEIAQHLCQKLYNKRAA